MRPDPIQTPDKFQALRITLRSMIEKLPDRPPETKSNLLAYNQKLQQISLFIQSTLIDPGNEIVNIVKSKKMANRLYDIARKNGHRATMNWLAQAGLINFKFRIKNNSSYKIDISTIRTFTPGVLSEPFNINSIVFPLVIKGYGEWEGIFSKNVQGRIVKREEIVKEIVKLNSFVSQVVEISIQLEPSGIFSHSIKLGYAPLEMEEQQEVRAITSPDPLDIFDELKHQKLTEASRRTRFSSYLEADPILSWPDATTVNDAKLNEVVIGSKTKKDIYRYILGLRKGTYTIENIKVAFNAQIKEIGEKYVPGWMEYAKKHASGIGAGPFAWLSMLKREPINKKEVLSNAAKLLQKAYRNLMIDKGAKIKE